MSWIPLTWGELKTTFTAGNTKTSRCSIYHFQDYHRVLVKSYLPYEWTTNGMLERVNMFTEKLNFCEHDEQWPPLKEMHIVLGPQGSSCKDACGENGFLCEPSFFNNINTVKEFEKIGITCKTHAREETLVEPSYNPSDQTCTIQAMSLIFSCVAKDSARRRLCPCRDYQPEQVAFCKNCR
ncbi:alpha-1,6-mannosylglycoprotein 6-beta-N-acetylglucosaminyltransferase A-like [Porites lutea]|uniref:alpha-1,6-mannosylglycoprotein 6-beta-N-acetylglucosaminyltransferase A-like n=1 Tax=Porites lutea TaxID=51062 RepID=UPI003CC54C4B